MRKLLALFALVSTLAVAEEQPFVTADLKIGQLGNQLFQVAAVMAYAWDNDAKPYFPDLNSPRANLSYNRDRIFFRLDSSDCPRPINHAYYEPAWHSPERVPFHPDQLLVGYFQSWKHFDHHRERILSLLAPSAQILSKLFASYGHLIGNERTVCVNVRTFNAHQSNSKRWPFLGLEYYRQALEFFPSDAIFVVFSDRIQWCKQHFSKMPKKFIFIEGQDAIEDLFLMSMMHHHILANSSLAWWGAYLNTRPDKIVVCPQNWTHPDMETFPGPPPNNFYFPNWIIVPNTFIEPYPADMKWYDDFSQSDDGDQ